MTCSLKNAVERAADSIGSTRNKPYRRMAEPLVGRRPMLVRTQPRPMLPAAPAYPGETPMTRTAAGYRSSSGAGDACARGRVDLTNEEPSEDEASARRLFEEAAGMGDARRVVRAVEELVR